MHLTSLKAEYSSMCAGVSTEGFKPETKEPSKLTTDISFSSIEFKSTPDGFIKISSAFLADTFPQVRETSFLSTIHLFFPLKIF